jgi:hypothetical protein
MSTVPISCAIEKREIHFHDTPFLTRFLPVFYIAVTKTQIATLAYAFEMLGSRFYMASYNSLELPVGWGSLPGKSTIRIYTPLRYSSLVLRYSEPSLRTGTSTEQRQNRHPNCFSLVSVVPLVIKYCFRLSIFEFPITNNFA